MKRIGYAAILPAVILTSHAHAQDQSDNGEQAGQQYAIAAANAEIFDFDVPAGSLSAVLKGIGDQARASIAVGGEVSDTPAPAIRGRFTLNQAIAVALQNKGWRVEANNSNTMRIVRAGEEEGGAGEIVVRARRTDFARRESSLLTRTDTSLRHTPATVDSVTEEVIKSQNLYSIGEAVRNIPGVIFKNLTSSQVIIGADSNGGNTFTNGLRNSSYAGNQPITDVETVEVLKGPASILTGSQVAGGTVNYVPKRANGNRNYYLSAGGGSGGEFVGTFDIGQSLISSAGLNYRLTGQVQKAENRPNGGNNPYSYSLGGMLGLRRDGLSADLGIQIFETRSVFPDFYEFIPATRTYRSYNDVLNRDQGLLVKSKRFYFGLEKALIDNSDATLKFRTRGQYQHVEQSFQAQSPFFRSPVPALGVVGTSSYFQGNDKQYSQYADLYLQASTGPLQHKLIVAGDFSKDTFDGFTKVTSFFGGEIAPLLTANSAVPSVPAASTTTQYGIVLQDQIEYGPVHVLLGIRRSWYEGVSRSNPAAIRSSTIVDYSPSAGLVVDVASWLSVYGSYQKGFTPAPPTQLTFSGAMLPPTYRKSHEVGFKASLFDDRLTVNGSYNWFDTVNFIRGDIAHPGFFLSIAGTSGKIVEISAAGTIAPSLKLLAGYVYSESRFKDGSIDYGNPQHVANFWLMKTFKLGLGNSASLGVGGNYSSGAPAVSTTNPTLNYVLDDSLAFRAAAGLQIKQTTINLSVENLFDRRNFEPSSNYLAVPIATPRTFRIVVGHRF